MTSSNLRARYALVGLSVEIGASAGGNATTSSETLRAIVSGRVRVKAVVHAAGAWMQFVPA